MAHVDDFRALHVPGDPLLMPNAWDIGSARVLAGLGFRAIATTSGGFAATLGRADGQVTRSEALAHGAALADAVDIPVSADLENCFADDPDGVAECVRLAVDAGLSGCSVEDWSGTAIYDRELAVERVAAAVAAAGNRLVVTARAENHIHDHDDLRDTIARLQAYAEAGAQVAFAPGVVAADDVDTLVREVPVPVSMLILPGAPPVSRLTELGVARISVGGTYTYLAYGALVRAAQELQQQGTVSGWGDAGLARPFFG